MRSLKRYIAESIKTYNYTIKIAGEVDKNFIDLFKYNLKKFDPVKISDPVSTPIQKSPYGFPGIENEKVTILKAEFRYPTTEPMILQLVQMLGYNVNMVRVIDSRYDDSATDEFEKYQNQMEQSPVLQQNELPDNGKEASKAYAKSYLDQIKTQAKDSKMDIPYEGKKTPDSFDPFKPFAADPKGTKSPMSTIKMPAKPKTGAKG